MTKRLYSIGTSLQLQVDVRISDFVAWRAVPHDQKGCIIVGRIQEVMTIASACRECAWETARQGFKRSSIPKRG